jgi:Ser/Thr protein kinase RdoA (MazF antagonist)
LNDTDIYIDSDYDKKFGAKNGNRRNWTPAINLKTWVEMGGALPDLDKVIEYCHNARPSFMNGDMIHGDIAIHNVLLRGDSVKFIDSLDVRRDVEIDDEWFNNLIKNLESLRK